MVLLSRSVDIIVQHEYMLHPTRVSTAASLILQVVPCQSAALFVRMQRPWHTRLHRHISDQTSAAYMHVSVLTDTHGHVYVET